MTQNQLNNRYDSELPVGIVYIGDVKYKCDVISGLEFVNSNIIDYDNTNLRIIIKHDYLNTVNDILAEPENVVGKGMYIPVYNQQRKSGIELRPSIVINLDMYEKSTIVHELCHHYFDVQYLSITDEDISFVNKKIKEGDELSYKKMWQKYHVFSEANAVFWQQKYIAYKYGNVSPENVKCLNYYCEYINNNNFSPDNEHYMYALGVLKFWEEQKNLSSEKTQKFKMLEEKLSRYNEFVKLFRYENL